MTNLDVMQRHALSVEECLQGSYLITSNCCQLFWLQLHPSRQCQSKYVYTTQMSYLLSSSETLEIWKPRMGTDGDATLLACTNSVLHDQGVAGMETAGDVGMVDQWYQFIVRATF